MKSSLTEEKFLIIVMASVFLLMAIHFFQPELANWLNPKDYTGIHTLLEFFSISISVAIFLYGLKSFEINRSSQMLLLAFTFLTVAMVDMLHTLSFKGMPYFITDSSVAKATWFWVIARALESILMLILILIPERKMKRDYRGLVILAGLMVTTVIAFIVIHFQNTLPILVVEGSGTTLLKNGIEYSISFLKLLSIIITLYQYFLGKNGTTLTIALVFVFLFLSELIFTTYQSVYDLENFTGHLFKVIGYYFILKAFYYSGTASELNKLHTFVCEQPGLIFQLDVRRNECTCTFCEGALLSGIGESSQEMNRQTSVDIFKILGHQATEFCLCPGIVNEQQTFLTNYMNKQLLILIKRLPRTEGIRSIIGSVVEVRNVKNLLDTPFK